VSHVDPAWNGPHRWSKAVVPLIAACTLLTISTVALFTAAPQGLRQGANEPQGAIDLTAGPPVDLQSDPAST
jgi:hypothetical protein